ncbi:MAG TPA: hypothetical protein VLA66_12085, partial [Thermoanaerobaculia bacterium]|nr:hypothetical protein [Thermoanaerobaculia bacterium]
MVQLLQILNGPLNFLQRDAEELRRLAPDAERSLPPLQKIFLEDDAATPRLGFPVLVTDELQALERAFEQYVTQEEEVEIAILQRASFDSQAFQGAWESYRLLLMRAAENVTTASYGRSFPAIFWLWHSGTMARVFRESPKRYLRRDLTVGREHGDALKYRIFQKVIDRLTHLNYELAQRLSSDTDEEEELLFPALFTRMRDNVLILTEEHVSPNLAELTSYFNGCLHLDGRDFRTRLMRLVEWYADELRADVELARLATVMGMPRQEDPRSHLTRRGMVAYLATRPGYDEESLLSPAQVQVWESLLVKLKEFELLQSLR